MNEIIKEFESKLENISWNKFYRARNIMKIFWYDKRERFEWAILRTIEKIKDEKIIANNFFPVERQKTWWRPWKDYLLTRWACYFLIQNCDERKQEVQIMHKYLKEVYLNQKIKKELREKNKYSWVFSSFKVSIAIFLIFFVLFFTIYYYSTFLKDYFSAKKEEFSNKNYISQIKETIKDDENTKIETEEKIEENTWSLVIPEKTPEEKFLENFQKYIDKWWDDFYIDLWKTINARNNFTFYLTWEKLIKSYFLLWNNAFYKDACSLLSKKYCNSGSKDLSSFSNFWTKTASWYEVLNVEKKEEWIYCLKIKYNLKEDLKKENSITETYNYHTEKIDGVEYISGRYCEKIEKNGKKIACPFKLTNYYCAE